MRKLVWLSASLTLLLVAATVVVLWPGPFGILTEPWAAPVLAFIAAGFLIVTRRPRHPIGWIFTVYAVVTSAAFLVFALGGEASTALGRGWADAIGNTVTTVSVLLIPAALLRFPDGTLPTDRWRWVSWLNILTALLGGSASLLNGGWGGDVAQAIEVSPLRAATQPLGDILSSLFYPLMALTMVVSALSLIVRYRRSMGVARQQMKWLAVAAAFLIAAFIIAYLTTGSAELGGGWLVWVVVAAFGSVPIAVAIAIIRYRLYDIDRIINRTIVYGLATGAVLAVYAATVFAVSSFAAETANNLTVALATLLAAAAFRPALRRVQRFVDRRFYRRRFNVQSTIDRFGSRLSHGTNLDALTDDLVGVVRSTMQPDQVGVWLRRAEAGR